MWPRNRAFDQDFDVFSHRNQRPTASTMARWPLLLLLPSALLFSVPKAPELWQEALGAERDRAELLLLEAQGLPATAVEALEALLERPLEASQSSFEALRSANDEVYEALQAAKAPQIASLPSLEVGQALPGEFVRIDLLPPVLESDGPALVPGAAHVRVSLPLVDNGAPRCGVSDSMFRHPFAIGVMFSLVLSRR